TCAAVNEDALHNPRVHVVQGDGREILALARQAYDLVVSEPSNPYRAGVASLYTRESYRTVAAHLAPRGLFVQGMQAYDIDGLTLCEVLATLQSVFPFVEVWTPRSRDLVFLASEKPIVRDIGRLRVRAAEEPFARAMLLAWRTRGVEGLLGHFVARTSMARA